MIGDSVINTNKRCCLVCNKEHVYSNIFKLRAAIKFNHLCKSCAKKGKNHPGYIENKPDCYYYQCCWCKLPIKYKTKGNRNRAEREKKVCYECRRIKISKSVEGRKMSEDFKYLKRKHQLERIEKYKITPGEDLGAKEWFINYNKNTNSNFIPTSFKEIGYRSDGYDKEKHVWIEYDTSYHKEPHQRDRDLIRQNNIIKHFKKINNPLNKFIRVLAYDSCEVPIR